MDYFIRLVINIGFTLTIVMLFFMLLLSIGHLLLIAAGATAWA